VESEALMTDEELELALSKAVKDIAQFGPEKDLANNEWRRLQRLKREKWLLETIKKDRGNKYVTREAQHMMEYRLLKEDKKMNPFLRYLMHLKVRSQLWW